VRPIVCQSPLIKIGEVLLNRISQTRILEVCGERQLANKIQGGAEIIVHTVRAVLESNPTWCCIETDSVNAFNSLDREQVSAKIRDHIPSTSPYVDFMLSGTEKVVYNDHLSKSCLVVDMECGIVQGAPMSMGLLNVTQADAMAEVDQVLQGGTTYGQAHDWYICAVRGEIIKGIAPATTEFAKLGLFLSEKNQIFSFIPFDPVEDAELIAGCLRYGVEMVTPTWSKGIRGWSGIH
jgi:hypothetical protein